MRQTRFPKYHRRLRQHLVNGTGRVVYGFIKWFTSFESVWQTTIVIFAGWAFESYTHLDPGHLLFLLVLSLYATFTQNALAFVSETTSQKIDEALAQIDGVVDDVYVATQALLKMAENETHLQEALATQTESMALALSELRTIVKQTKP